MSTSAVLRLKRKACNEPLDGLVVALKKSKSDEDSNTSTVFFKFAATLKSESESVRDHIQAVLSKDNSSKYTKWRDPKSTGQKNVQQVCEKFKKEYKAATEKKRFDLLNNRRLIFSETVPIEDEDEENSPGPNAEVRKLFQLYDIIEENEEVKKQVEDVKSTITCNGELLVREKAADYVYDVYISDVQIDDSFVKNTISVRPCTITDADIYSGDSDDGEECCDDEDDSNDENNWRNEYPEDEDSQSDRDSYESDLPDPYNCNTAIRQWDSFHLEDSDEFEAVRGDDSDEYEAAHKAKDEESDDHTSD